MLRVNEIKITNVIDNHKVILKIISFNKKTVLVFMYMILTK